MIFHLIMFVACIAGAMANATNEGLATLFMCCAFLWATCFWMRATDRKNHR